LYGIFPLASLGYLPISAPSQLLHTCSLVEHQSLEKGLDFLVTTKTISGINILVALNPNHSSYWEENRFHLSEPKSGHPMKPHSMWGFVNPPGPEVLERS